MTKLKQFYETTEQRVPFNELSVESLDILEKSKAYKRYINNKTMKTREEKWRNFFTTLLKWSVLIVVIGGCLWAAFFS